MLWKRYPHTWFWLNMAAASTLVFWWSRWDVDIESLFYIKSGGAGHDWVLDDFPTWKMIFYDGIPYVSLLVLLSGMVLILLSTWRRWYWLRIATTYMLLVFIVGCGIVVNGVFKEHWGRARPVQLEQFGGEQAYSPPLLATGGEGRSFPSGHSSVGFAFIGFWFLWRRHRPERAAVVLGAALLLGGVTGLVRMAAGGHFLSDVIWSAWILLFAAWLLYYKILDIPGYERRHGYAEADASDGAVEP